MKTQFAPSLFVPAALLLALLPAARSLAAPGLAFTLTPATITAGKSSADQTFTFSGTLTNNTATPLFLNGDLFTPDTPLSGDDMPFINTFVFPTDTSGNPTTQPTLGVGQSVTDPLFTVTLPAGTAPGTYHGLFEIQGGPTTSDYGLLASQSFTVDATPGHVAAVPEASSGVSFGVGLLVVAGLAVKSRRRKGCVGA